MDFDLRGTFESTHQNAHMKETPTTAILFCQSFFYWQGGRFGRNADDLPSHLLSLSVNRRRSGWRRLTAAKRRPETSGSRVTAIVGRVLFPPVPPLLLVLLRVLVLTTRGFQATAIAQ